MNIFSRMKIGKKQVLKFLEFNDSRIPIKFVWDYDCGDFYYTVAPQSFMKVFTKKNSMKFKNKESQDMAQHITYFIPDDKFNLSPLALSKYVSSIA